MSATAPQPARPQPAPTPVPADRYVLPERLATAQTGRGPRFGEAVWNFRAFIPPSTRQARQRRRLHQAGTHATDEISSAARPLARDINGYRCHWTTGVPCPTS